MSFCSKCGRQLMDGQVCGCQLPKEAAPDFITDILNLLKGIFKKPADAVATYVKNGSTISSVIILAVCAVLNIISSLLFRVVTNIKYEAQATQNINMWDPTTWVAPEPIYSGWEIVLGIVGAAVSTFVSATVLAGMLYVLLNFVFQKDSKVSFGQVLAVASLAAIARVPFAFVGTIISLVPLTFFGMVGGWVSAFGTAVGYVFTFIGIRTVEKDDNNMLLVYGIAAVATAVVSSFLSLVGLV